MLEYTPLILIMTIICSKIILSNVPQLSNTLLIMLNHTFLTKCFILLEETFKILETDKIKIGTQVYTFTAALRPKIGTKDMDRFLRQYPHMCRPLYLHPTNARSIHNLISHDRTPKYVPNEVLSAKNSFIVGTRIHAETAIIVKQNRIQLNSVTPLQNQVKYVQLFRKKSRLFKLTLKIQLPYISFAGTVVKP